MFLVGQVKSDDSTKTSIFKISVNEELGIID